MNESRPYLVFRLDDQRYALALSSVDRVVWAVEPTEVPNPPAFLIGVIDVEGSVIPVLSLRKCFGAPEREIQPEDTLLIARTQNRPVSLLISEALEIAELSDGEIVEAEEISDGLRQIQGVVQLGEGLVLIQNLDTLLSNDQSEALDRALAGAAEAV